MSTSDELSDSLHGALSKARIPAENHEFIQRITAAIGIAGYRAMAVDSSKPYVLTTRRDGQAALHIHYGFTNGFTSEDEIVRAAGQGVERQESSRRGTWYVAHPLTKVAPRGERSRDVRREGGFCSCGMQLSVSGVCGSCD
ncbi:hypothetical protein H7K04_26075 [Mycolicibacterium fluoranthenivorans]|uniref:hypothetical protein n=1 Tax=Mycolicibacterium fluoranthenivorans TaxID=258505 RepID=UPI00141D9055|nr:hypothetical protein [Mycolicibacterium fluoranthenivorans]MCV7358913.1 hypothetical protein [Mycolicibacterium fluoranthenivorans]